MQLHNVNKINIINDRVTKILVSDFKNVISDVGIDLDYYFFDGLYKEWTSYLIGIKGYVMSNSDNEDIFLKVKDRYDVLISAESFFDSNGDLIAEPNKKDKIKIANKDYHISDIHFYNIQAGLTNTIRNSMAVAFELIYKGDFTRADIVR